MSGCGGDDGADTPFQRDAGFVPVDASQADSAGRGGGGGRAGEAGGSESDPDAGQLGGSPAPGSDPDAGQLGGSPAPGSDPDAGEPPPANDCTGSWIVPDSSEDAPQALRSDVAVNALFAIPGDATRLARDPVSGALYLLRQSGSVQLVDTVGRSSSVAWTADDMQIPSGYEALGMAFAPDGTLYVVTHRAADAAPTDLSQATIVRGTLEPGGGRSFGVFANSAAYPRSNTFFDHEWSGVVVSRDGRHVYVNCGSRTDHGEVQSAGGLYPDTREVALTARILRLPTDALTPLDIPNDETQLQTNQWVFARGTRNSFDLEFAPNGDLIAPDNGPDGDYHEELNWLREGRHYGFPWRLADEDNPMASSPYDPMDDPRLQEGYSATREEYWHDDPLFPAPDGITFTDPIPNLGPDADQYRDLATGEVARASATGRPYATFSDHGSPLGLTFDPGSGALCGEFSGKAFILRFGVGADPNDFEVGRDLLFLDLAKNGGAYSLSARQLVRGFRAPIDAVLQDGTMYVLDRSEDGQGDAGGTLYAIALPTRE